MHTINIRSRGNPHPTVPKIAVPAGGCAPDRVVAILRGRIRSRPGVSTGANGLLRFVDIFKFAITQLALLGVVGRRLSGAPRHSGRECFRTHGCLRFGHIVRLIVLRC